MDGSFNRINTRGRDNSNFEAGREKRLNWVGLLTNFFHLFNEKLAIIILNNFLYRKINDTSLYQSCQLIFTSLFYHWMMDVSGYFLITFHSFWLISTRFAFFSLFSFNLFSGDSTVVAVNNTNALNICAE